MLKCDLLKYYKLLDEDSKTQFPILELLSSFNFIA